MKLEIPEEMLEAIARRAAEIVVATKAPEAEVGFIDVAAAAEYLAAPTSRIYSLVSAKRIPHHRDGSRLLFDRAELRAWVEAGGAKRP